MEEIKDKAGKKNKIWIWAIIIIILLVLFFAFRSDKTERGTGEADELSALDIGDNPDLGVDDFDSLQVSQEEIAS